MLRELRCDEQGAVAGGYLLGEFDQTTCGYPVAITGMGAGGCDGVFVDPDGDGQGEIVVNGTRSPVIQINDTLFARLYNDGIAELFVIDYRNEYNPFDNTLVEIGLAEYTLEANTPTASAGITGGITYNSPPSTITISPIANEPVDSGE